MGEGPRLTQAIRRGALTRTVIGFGLWPVILALPLLRAVTTNSWSAAVGALSLLALVIVAYHGLGIPVSASVPRWERYAVAVAGVATAVDICLRAPHLADDLTSSSAALPVLVVVLLGVVVSGRRRRHDGSVHLQWPLGPGTFQIIEGSGRILNHHWIEPSQREALDIVGSAPDGRSHRRLAPQRLSDYPLFGHPVTAPTSGTVVARVDGRPDHPVRGGTPAGNHVVIDTGSEYVVLAHLTPGSVQVAKGDHVKVGDLVGRVGSSGNSTEPHLHIHATRHGQPLQLRFPQQPGPIRRNMAIKVNRGCD